MSFIAIRKFTGTGSPEGVVTAPPGGTYTQSDATGGQELWDKATGTSNTGWRLRPPGGTATTNVVYASAYGAKGDGTGNDATAIQAAHDYIVSTGKAGTVILDGATYRMTAGLTINLSYASLIAYGAKIDASPITSGVAMTFTGTINPPYYQSRSRIEGFELVGNGLSGSVTGINFENPSSSGEGPSHASVKNVVVHHFGTGISLKSRSYALTFYTCDVWSCTTGVSSPSGGTDYGERYSFIGCTIFGNTTGISGASVNTDFYLQSTSIDYCNQLLNITGGWFVALGSHFETNFDTDYPIYCSGLQTALKIIGSTIVDTLGGARTHGLAYSDASASTMGIEISNTQLNYTSSGPEFLIAGGGRAVVKDLTTLSGGNPLVASQYQNILAKGDFADSTAFSEWTITTSPDVPVIDTTTFHSSPASAKFKSSVNGNSVQMYTDVPVQPGQTVGCAYYRKTVNLVSNSDVLYLQYQYLGANNLLLFADTVIYEIADVPSWAPTGFTLKPITGTRTVRLIWYALSWHTTSTYWLDDVAITAH